MGSRTPSRTVVTAVIGGAAACGLLAGVVSGLLRAGGGEEPPAALPATTAAAPTSADPAGAGPSASSPAASLPASAPASPSAPASASASASGTPAVQPAPGPAAGRYTLVLAGTQLAADVEGASVAPGARVMGWQFSGAPHQLWQLQPSPAGGYHLVAAHSGQCLTTAGGAGAPVVQQPCADPAAAGGWGITALPGLPGQWALTDAATGLAVGLGPAGDSSLALLPPGSTQGWVLTPA
ncbi:RICIN domain-containing protein [Allostreptomyces psammosilenae]|uniref:Ricin B lectin domain-containing protein n=1 Tax=Allostreptomyces psammosilenae TaxID=1892865 RepID=A0A853A0S0_9ACTN|nr:RICIN domain-containing protein [Allostreptomyces psammosilenae]NYI08166.1 hypothetical protein [Allostreptomyces psammosilenae]